MWAKLVRSLKRLYGGQHQICLDTMEPITWYESERGVTVRKSIDSWDKAYVSQTSSTYYVGFPEESTDL